MIHSPLCSPRCKRCWKFWSAGLKNMTLFPSWWVQVFSSSLSLYNPTMQSQHHFNVFLWLFLCQGRWLFALLACLEKPLLPGAHSSIRQLARRCAQLRSTLVPFALLSCALLTSAVLSNQHFYWKPGRAPEIKFQMSFLSQPILRTVVFEVRFHFVCRRMRRISNYPLWICSSVLLPGLTPCLNWLSFTFKCSFFLIMPKTTFLSWQIFWTDWSGGSAWTNLSDLLPASCSWRGIWCLQMYLGSCICCW